ncbi:hypothetical protein ACOTD8_28670, partial [Achromobacter dolens]|uniref:hypothetical protein n=1 Tax=Achromobacter dolens TaxID=1287738 RepID=UPI003B9D2572
LCLQRLDLFGVFRGLDLLAQFRAFLFRMAFDGGAGLLAERRDDFRFGLHLPAQFVGVPFFRQATACRAAQDVFDRA